MTNLNFTCPYCNQPTTITDPNYFEEWTRIVIAESDKGDAGLFSQAITCPNHKCGKMWLHIQLCRSRIIRGSWYKDKILQEWQLLPESEAKVLPDYIPQAIQNDYYEACRIRDLSPKASATLARRCLQGMIRDFWRIKKKRLKDEIDALEEKIDPIVWEGIDVVRSVGNIGAHMEKDINIIVDVEPKEAQLLIGLIERLINDWYIARKNKEDHMAELKELVKSKDEKKNKKDED
ncbi:DUF4145 domain-containing protein [Candidatus Parcubacteria bacterium]|nr:DUF4145 domain-containing protein [Candidatus Parcubacteria bacterium]